MKNLDELNAKELEAFAFHAMTDFCNGYFWMFEKKIECTRVSAERKTAEQLKQACSGIIALNKIAYGGAGSGSFLVVFDKSALFSLGGTTVMLPPMRIKEECLRGTAEGAATLSDAVGEIGNLIAGAFNKVLREGCRECEGLGDDIRLHLRLPVPVGSVGMDLDSDTASYHVFTYKFVLAGLDPFSLKVVFANREG